MLHESDYKVLREEIYGSFDSGKGKCFEDGKLSLDDLYNIAK